MPKTNTSNDAIAMLKADHQTVKKLFEEFEDAKKPSEKERIITEAVNELKVHATLEEELFYPAIQEVGDDVMLEAEQEHHVARVLIAELDELDEDEEHRNAKFTVLSEAVKHHIQEEESEVLPKAKALDIDFEELGTRMMERKTQLQEEGVPTDDEHELVSMSAGAGQGEPDSKPASMPRERTAVTHAGKGGSSKTSGRRAKQSTH